MIWEAKVTLALQGLFVYHNPGGRGLGRILWNAQELFLITNLLGLRNNHMLLGKDIQLSQIAEDCKQACVN